MYWTQRVQYTSKLMTDDPYELGEVEYITGLDMYLNFLEQNS